MSTHNELKPALQWLDCLIEREVLRLRARYELSMEELRGLYISDQQVDGLIRERLGSEGYEDPAAHLSARAKALAPEFDAASPLCTLAIRLGLSVTDLDVLMLALAPEIDARYETLYAYLNNDVSRKYLTVDLGLRLLKDARHDEPGRALFATTSPLCSSGALEPIDPPDRRSSLQRGFIAAPLVVQLLTNQPLVDARWPSSVRWLHAGGSNLLASSTLEALTAAGGVPLTLIVGDEPMERLRCASTWAELHARSSLYVPLSVLAQDLSHSKTLMLAARLANAAIVLEDDLPRDAGDCTRISSAIRSLIYSGASALLLCATAARWMQTIVDLPFARVNVSHPNAAERAALWQRSIDIPESCAKFLGHRFAIGPARIAAIAQSVAATSASEPSPEQLIKLLSAQADQRVNDALNSLATRLCRPHTWLELVLPATTLKQLQEVASAISQRDRVYMEWGMLKRTARSCGLIALFSGASGTGKTMAASVIANEAGLDLYRIDLASVVSKYIGETEQNLDRIFNAARGADAILFFDEADALLGKRSEIKDAHDRYANLEVAYLLQKMEEHDGVVVLASNLPKNLDSAFSRRMHYTVEFARPNSRLRELLWRGMFPDTVPLATDIDFAFLAEKFEITGGEIQAIALDAAFLAAAEGSPVGMAQLMRAMTRRQTKQGNPGGLARFHAHRDLLNGTDAMPIERAM